MFPSTRHQATRYSRSHSPCFPRLARLLFSAFHAAGNATRRMNIFRTLCKVSISPWIDAREKGVKNKNKTRNSATLCSVSRINRSVWPEKSFSTVLPRCVDFQHRPSAIPFISSLCFLFTYPRITLVVRIWFYNQRCSIVEHPSGSNLDLVCHVIIRWLNASLMRPF